MARNDAEVTMFRPRPDIRLGRRWQVLSQGLHGFVLVAQCGFVQGEIWCETTTTNRDRLLTGDMATLERRVCCHCIGAVRRDSRLGM